jgi:hypothetical protein
MFPQTSIYCYICVLILSSYLHTLLYTCVLTPPARCACAREVLLFTVHTSSLCHDRIAAQSRYRYICSKKKKKCNKAMTCGAARSRRAQFGGKPARSRRLRGALRSECPGQVLFFLFPPPFFLTSVDVSLYHTAVFVSSYCYLCVLILLEYYNIILFVLYSYYLMCPLTAKCVCSLSAVYASSFFFFTPAGASTCRRCYLDISDNDMQDAVC